MKNCIHLFKMTMFIFGFILSFSIHSQTCGTTIVSYPYSENFESGIGSWTQDAGDNFDWTRNSGGTSTGSTGPSGASSGTYYIYTEASGNSNNTSNFESPCFNLTSLSNPRFSFNYHMYGSNTGTINIDISTNNGTSYPTNLWTQAGQVQTSNGASWNAVNLDLSAYAGLTVKIRIQGITGSGSRSDMAIDNVSLVNFVPSSEIDVQGNSVSITNGDNTPSKSDHTNFGTANSGVQISRTFTIYNTGSLNLNITSIILSNAIDFSITGTPYTTPVAIAGSTTFTVTFNSVSLGTKSTTVTILNNDPDEGTYQFDIEARSEENFFDSDGDGVFDNLDIDDDNDGIKDSDEELACKKSSTAVTANYKFLNETFGTGNRTTINTTYDAVTTYCYEDATVGANTIACPSLSNIDLNDGEYTVYYKAADGDGTNDTPNGEVASWADQYWYTGADHTSGDINGRMAMFNASYDPGIFYTATIIGSLPNVPITYSFWVLNLDTTTAPGIATRLRPDILVEFRDVNDNVLASISTGDIPPSINGNPANSWHQFTADLTFNVSEFYVYFINNEVGGGGNDLAIDDIVISQTLCDTDSDGVADVFDLDSDNDGIPDVVEGGFGYYSEGKATLTGTTFWVDANSNGMHDSSETNTPLDSDGDGVPNYLDLDSDNDSIFDVDESNTGNSADLSYQNGDGDITGDGVGDGPDTDAVRETDLDSDGVLEYYTDGILDIYDYFNGGTFTTAYGNSNQTIVAPFPTPYYYVQDTDNDGIPDYIDTTSDGTTFDISHTLYANLDTNNDGVIDDTNDTDGDGIVDLFDTEDNQFGSPRDLDRKLHLYFDGRNDYAAETSVINGWTEASIMAWIKIHPSASGTQIIAGQDRFNLQLNADKSINAYGDGNVLSNGTPLNTNQWVHVASTYSSSNNIFKLYINGTESSNATISGVLSPDTSSFTIGRKPDTDSNYYHGYMDEVRIFNKALSNDELKKMIHQEIENNSGVTRGSIVPKDITDFIDESNITPLNWSHLVRYYKMDTYKDDILDDFTTPAVDVGSRAKIHNTKIIDVQSAPLPYVTNTSFSGNWSDPSNWVHGDVWDISNSTPESAIVQIKGNMQTNTDIPTVGLILDSGSSLEINGDSELSNSWYLKLDGFIDLQGESQLVQGPDSELAVNSQGKLERDQQGNKNLFSYNYWSSPVGRSSTSSNNNDYKLPEVLYDGSIATAPVPINFLTSGYNGNPGNPGTTPISIADYWIWKYANKTYDSYASWQHVRSTGTLYAGEGFTMKGVQNSVAAFSQEQNYAFNGKPNNGDISLTLSAGNEYLIGNPYPSALDADEFILDNISTGSGGRAPANIINGSLYFWDHFAVATHNLAEYEGGYATYNLIGGLPAISNDARINATGGIGTKIPKQFIPVSQGFFVTADAGGSIMFKNSQRIFKTEAGDPSLFLKSSNVKSKSNTSDPGPDGRKKIRLAYNSPKGYHRQLLVGVDENATSAFDFGYDAPLIDTVKEDMFWIFDGKNYIIQGVNDFSLEQKLPLGIKTIKEGAATIKIDVLENMTNETNIFLHDKELNVYHDLKQGGYEVFLSVGEYLNRFEIAFSQAQTLGTNDIKNNQLEVLYSNEKRSIVINNPNSTLIDHIEMFNVLGQAMFRFETNTSDSMIEYKAAQIPTGNYIIKIQTEYGKLSKKVLVK